MNIQVPARGGGVSRGGGEGSSGGGGLLGGGGGGEGFLKLSVIPSYDNLFSPNFTAFFCFLYYIQHCRPSNSSVSEDARIERRTFATSVLAYNISARSHPLF